MGEDDPALVGRRLPVAVPAVDQIVTRLLACCGGMHHAMRVIGMDRIARPAGRQIAGGVALPVLPLAAHLADLRAAVAFEDRAERRARLDGLQLLRIADQHNLGASLGGMGQHALQLARADHARLVDDQHIAGSEQVAALSPTMFQAGDGARRDARSAFQILGRDAGQRHAPDLVARRFPGFARHAQHRALSRPGIADHDAKIAPVRDMRKRLGLLPRKHKAARFCTRQRHIAVPVADLMAFLLGHEFGGAVQTLFGLDHLAGGEAVLAASVLAEFDQLGRAPHRAHDLR